MPWTPGLSVRVLTTERARLGHALVVDSLVRLVQDERLAGVTVMRAIESMQAASPASGVGAPGASESGVRRYDAGAPVIVDIIDRTDRIEAALPRIAALVGASAMTVTEARIYLPASRLSVRDIATPARVTARPDAPLSEALAALLDQSHLDTRLIPVVDGHGTVVGVLTLGHLLDQMDPEFAAHLLELGAPERIHAHVLRQAEGRTVAEVMRAPALTIAESAAFDDAARFFATHQLTRAPVTDKDQRLVGLVSEHALVAALTAPLLASSGGANRASGAGGGAAPTGNGVNGVNGQNDHATTSAELRTILAQSVAPGGERLTAGALVDREIPRVAESASWREVAQAIESMPDDAPARLALVVDGVGALRGVIDERDMLRQLVGPSASGALAPFRRMFGGALHEIASLSNAAEPRQHAGALAQPATPTAPADMSIAAALAEMVKAHEAGYAVVVDAKGRPEGALWRGAALHALVGL